MSFCAACKNKTSTERCLRAPLKDTLFCKTHIKCKNNRIWAEVNCVDSKVIRIQKVWRGYSVRMWLTLAGPGVLKRSICHNEEELITMEDKNSLSPLDYFAFEESGKIYWFDFKSINQNSFDKVSPQNPYTRNPLSIDTRQRLRKLAIIRQRRGILNLHNSTVSKTPDDITLITWTQLCQIIEENGFFEISPMYFMSMNRTQLYVFINLVLQNLVSWAAEHTNPKSPRKRYISKMKELNGHYFAGTSSLVLSHMTALLLVTILNHTPQPYDICFFIMSAMENI